jgi:hypothetical protein
MQKINVSFLAARHGHGPGDRICLEDPMVRHKTLPVSDVPSPDEAIDFASSRWSCSSAIPAAR